MSALPPKADIVRHGGYVRFVPKADIAAEGSAVRGFLTEAQLAALRTCIRRHSLTSPGAKVATRDDT
jgi:hypothetical protein